MNTEGPFVDIEKPLLPTATVKHGLGETYFREGTQSPFADTNGQMSLRQQLEEAQRRLREAEQIITGLKAAQDVIKANSADLKKESNHLREELAVLRSQTPQAGNNGNQANARTTVTPNPEDVKNLQECLQEIKHESKEILRQSKEVHRQTGELRDCVLSKQEQLSRKRPHTDSDTGRNEEERPSMHFVKMCKRYNSQTTRCTITFQGALKPFIEDLSHAYESKSSLSHEKIRRNLADCVYSRKSYSGWHCLREVCEKGKLSTEVKSVSVCQLHGSDCELLVSKRPGNPCILGFTSFGNFNNSTK
ncbi:hypothetical protein FACUT_2637 [Fusarium acutatum]|uniref:Uncharacterized protein n=1 Tax=Fusarium acutatum TaxID=78861 RepID=A0A8H4K2B9_9HYPO|nr:hypothetical protein FACUT_2637 [Fusarium acutatum]